MMDKIILHVTRYRTPDTWEFNEIEDAVDFAIEGMYENNFAIDYIADESGNILLTKDEILGYPEHAELPRERPQTIFSDHMLRRLVSEPITEIYKDCSLYFYGYEHGSYKEVVLAKNLRVAYPFDNASAEATMDGIYTRFEVVSNTDLFCFMSADIGNSIYYPVRMSNTCAVVGSTACISMFSIKY